MDYSEDLIALIDQRIRVATARTQATGTCVARATTGNSADVMFTGSTVAMPVRVLGSVFLQPGDRCVLNLYGGSEWVVTGSWGALGYGEASYQTFGPPGGTGALSSASFVDVSEIPPIIFDKISDGTYVRMGLSVGCYCETTANSAVQFGFRWTAITPNGYPGADLEIGFRFFNQIGVHENIADMGRWLGIPAGKYQVQLRWRRTTGTGTFKIDAADRISVEIDEGIQASAPIL